MKKILFFGIIFIGLLLFSFYLQSTGTPTTQSLWTYELQFLGQHLKIVDFLIASVVFCISVMIILLIFMLFNRRKMERRAKIKEDLLIKYQALLMDYLQGTKRAREFQPLANSRFKRQILIDEMTDFALNLKGETFQKIKTLYFHLNFNEDTFRKLRSRHWHKKIKAFKELYALNITEKNDVLYKHINSKNHLLRIEAQIALVDLSKEDPDEQPFEFLTKLTTPFSLWEQITLHQVMVQREIKVPDFGTWIFSDNPTVIMFCLRMIREYKQIENAAKIKMLLYHDNETVRKLAIEVLGDLKLNNEIISLEKNYEKETKDNRFEIIKSMAKSPDTSLIEFLQKVIDEEKDADILIEAVKAINNMGDPGQEVLKKMMASEYKDYNIIIKHVLDKKIN
jgi:hypothetical protein